MSPPYPFGTVLHWGEYDTTIMVVAPVKWDPRDGFWGIVLRTNGEAPNWLLTGSNWWQWNTKRLRVVA